MNFPMISGTVYVVQNNIDTDQILSTEFLTINPGTEKGYRKLGTLAMCGLPASYPPFVSSTTKKAIHPIIIAGENFGCGSSREHAPIALGASGVKVVIAQSFARIFLRNCLTTGQVIPLQISEKLFESLITGDLVEILLSQRIIRVFRTSQEVAFEAWDTFLEVVQFGGLFPYARQLGKIEPIIINRTGMNLTI